MVVSRLGWLPNFPKELGVTKNLGLTSGNPELADVGLGSASDLLSSRDSSGPHLGTTGTHTGLWATLGPRPPP